MKAIVHLIVMMIIGLVSSQTSAAKSTDWALIIGITKYVHPQEREVKIEYAAKDAIAFRDFLASPEGGRFDSENIKLMIDDDARRENINGGISWLGRNAQNSGTVYVYISGHAVLSGNNNLQLIPHDGSIDDSVNSLISIDEFIRHLHEQVDSRNMFIFLDVCHAGATIPSQYFPTLPGRSRMIFASAAKDQTARESRELESSIFSHYLIAALRSAAKQAPDGNMRGSDIVDRVTAQVLAQALKEHHVEQRPIAWPSPPPNLVLGRRVTDRSPSLNDQQMGPPFDLHVPPPAPPMPRSSRQGLLWGLVGGLGVVTVVGVTVGLIAGLHPCLGCLEKTLTY
ncbi:MAG: caspase family protein [Myxococcales bacterium]|nr:caspase family protein [Myxococcales bacterium]